MTVVNIGFITTTVIVRLIGFLGINLIHQVSDKRLLERCGDGKSYLNETRSGSIRPSGLRMRRAEAWTKRTSRSGCSVSRRKPETFFQRLSHRASEMKGFGPGLSETDATSSGKCATVPERHFVPEFSANRRRRKESRKVLL
jgi:hypothetical protein